MPDFKKQFFDMAGLEQYGRDIDAATQTLAGEVLGRVNGLPPQLRAIALREVAAKLVAASQQPP